MRLYINIILILGLSCISFYVQAGVLATGVYSSDESGEKRLLPSHIALTNRTDEELICQVNLHKHSLGSEFEELSPVEMPFSGVNDCDNYQSMSLHGTLMDLGWVENKMRIADIAGVRRGLLRFGRTVMASVVDAGYMGSILGLLRNAARYPYAIQIGSSGILGCAVGTLSVDIDFDYDDTIDMLFDSTGVTLSLISWGVIIGGGDPLVFGSLFFGNFVCLVTTHKGE